MSDFFSPLSPHTAVLCLQDSPQVVPHLVPSHSYLSAPIHGTPPQGALPRSPPTDSNCSSLCTSLTSSFVLSMMP